MAGSKGTAETVPARGALGHQYNGLIQLEATPVIAATERAYQHARDLTRICKHAALSAFQTGARHSRFPRLRGKQGTGSDRRIPETPWFILFVRRYTGLPPLP